MKKILLIIVIILLTTHVFPREVTAFASNEQNVTPEQMVDNLDLSELDRYFASLSAEEKAVLGYGATDYIKKLISGEVQLDFKTLAGVLTIGSKSLIGSFSYLGVIISICIINSLILGLLSKNSENSIQKATNFGNLCTMSGIVLVWIYNVFKEVAAYITALKKLFDAVFPIMLSLLTASSATTSAGALTPAATVLSAVFFGLLSSVVLPLIVVMLIVSVASKLSNAISFSNVANLIKDVCQWILRTSFLIFTAYMSVQGIFSGIKDSVSLKLTKFSLSKYIPVIGGYLSDGINYVIAGSIIIKNSVGLMAVVLLLLKLLPIFLSILATSISLKILSAVAEPLGCGAFCSVFKSVDGCVSLMLATVLGASFLFAIFMSGAMLCGNSVV